MDLKATIKTGASAAFDVAAAFTKQQIADAPENFGRLKTTIGDFAQKHKDVPGQVASSIGRTIKNTPTDMEGIKEMATNNKMKTAGGVAAAALLAFTLAAAPLTSNDALAQDRGHVQTASTASISSEPTAFDLAQRAGNYSVENDAVGIFINIAPDTRFTPERLGSLIVNKFKEDGINSAYIAHRENEGTSSVSFFVRGVPYTGYGIDKIEEGYNHVALTIRALQAEERNTLALN